MMTLRAIAAASFFVTLVACTTTPKETAPSAEPFSFAVIGDIPYNDDDRDVFDNKIVPAIQQGGYPFVIHVGDYKSGGAPCTAQEDDTQNALIEKLAPIPVFYTPGDNEWTDCDRFVDPATGKPQSELQRLARLKELFFEEPVDAPEAMSVRMQPDAPGNVMWRYEGVRFVTVHVVGTGNGRRAVAGDDPDEAGPLADARERDAVNWITAASIAAKSEKAKALVIAMHADMSDVNPENLGVPCNGAVASLDETCDAFVALRLALRKAAETFGGPTLLIHGDTAPFTLGQSFAGEELANFWVLNAAGDHGVTGEGFHYGVQDSTRVIFDPSASNPFDAWGIATGQRAKQ
ncbi:metallophosphoesterase family protein [Marinicaulis aureus]|uniref:Metallophosphoesterase family protein n=1 Tax=Hyphococcus aureus TaxID=2666033 RepID=A0ABW1L0B6_9PROT